MIITVIKVEWEASVQDPPSPERLTSLPTSEFPVTFTAIFHPTIFPSLFHPVLPVALHPATAFLGETAGGKYRYAQDCNS